MSAPLVVLGGLGVFEDAPHVKRKPIFRGEAQDLGWTFGKQYQPGGRFKRGGWVDAAWPKGKIESWRPLMTPAEERVRNSRLARPFRKEALAQRRAALRRREEHTTTEEEA